MSVKGMAGEAHFFEENMNVRIRVALFFATRVLILAAAHNRWIASRSCSIQLAPTVKLRKRNSMA
jgi:hypothetical protein